MSPSTRSTSPPSSSRFSRLPVEKLSRMRTSYPSRSRRSVTWDPMKPAPPVTRAFTGAGYGRGLSEDPGYRYHALGRVPMIALDLLDHRQPGSEDDQSQERGGRGSGREQRVL